MKLLGELAEIVEQIESELDLHLTDEDFADGQDEIVHIFLHESCHAALSNRVPWIHDVTDEQHTAVDEILARLLEDHMSSLLGLPAHTPEQHVHELGMYPVRITVEQYEHLRTGWQQRYGPDKDLEGMATYTLNYLLPDEEKGDCV